LLYSWAVSIASDQPGEKAKQGFFTDFLISGTFFALNKDLWQHNQADTILFHHRTLTTRRALTNASVMWFDLIALELLHV
jgi:hypothetical protein